MEEYDEDPAIGLGELGDFDDWDDDDDECDSDCPVCYPEGGDGDD